MAATPQRPLALVFGLARADLRHEWILTLCMVLAIAAVLAPLLLMFGIKYGTIETLRQRLVQDPRNREIRPLTGASFEREWFEAIRRRGDVAFVTPFTRQIAATLQASLQGREESQTLDIIPTGQGDPLLLENGAPIPGPGQCVLSHAAARELGAEPGKTLLATVQRLQGNRYESARASLKVAGVLSPQAGMHKAVYTTLEFLEGVEQYKDGLAVPAFGWPGAAALAYPVYDGLLLLLPRELDKLQEVGLINNTGFNRVERIDPGKALARLGFRLETSGAAYLVYNANKPAGQESLEAVRLRLRGMGASLLPWVAGIKARLLDQEQKPLAELTLKALGQPPPASREHAIQPNAGWEEETAQSAPLRRVLLPPGVELPGGQGWLRLNRGGLVLAFPVRAEPARAPGSQALIPARLAGVLNLFQVRSILYQEQEERFLLARRGYAGFRLYAAGIDDVEPLRRHFQAQGLTVHTEAERIQDVVRMDSYLTLIFWLVALVGLAGGVASLTASFYAAVERKRRDLSVLRLLGLSRFTLFFFPVFQGVMVGAGGFLAAWLFFAALALAINTLFQDHLQAQESLCRLHWWHLCAALAATLLVGLVSAGMAALRASSVDPAETLRND